MDFRPAPSHEAIAKASHRALSISTRSVSAYIVYQPFPTQYLFQRSTFSNAVPFPTQYLFQRSTFSNAVLFWLQTFNVSFDRVWHEITELGVPPADFLVGPDLVDLGACTAVVGGRLVFLGPARILRQD
jgi:hypothetical protein